MSSRDRAGACLLALALAACQKKPPAEGAQAPPGEAWLTDRQVQEAKIAVEALGVHPVGGPVVAGGHIAFDDVRVAHLFSPVTGRVTQVVARPGERVRRGAPLALIQSPDVGAAFSDLAKAQADLAAAEHEARRQKELFAAHAGSQRDLENAEDSYRKAQAEHARAREKARLLGGSGGDAVTQAYTLRSPFEGEVIARNLSPGMELQGQYSGGQAVELFTIGELDVVWVVADVFEIDLPRIALGAEVTVRVFAYPDRAFTGKVDWISGALDPVARTAKVRCTLPNPRRELKPEMFATVEIAAQRRSALALPRSAVLRLGDQVVVFVEAGRSVDGRLRFERRPVTVDESQGGDWLPVLRGVTEKDRVVSSGGILLVGLL
jgi:membrane fusion protein, heavy metal efflux system